MKKFLVFTFLLISGLLTVAAQSETELKLKAAMQEADQQRMLAIENEKLARQAEERALRLESKVMQMRYAAIANEIAERSVEIKDKELAALLAVLARSFFEKSYNGSSFNNKTYAALLMSIKKFGQQSSNNELAKLLGADARSTSAVMPDKRVHIEADPDGSLKLVSDGIVKMTLAGHRDQVDQIRFNHAGTFMITAGRDNTIRIWNLKQLNLRPLVIAESAAISNLTVSPDDKQIIYVVGASPKTTKAQPLNIEEVVASLCKVLTRDLTVEEWKTYVATDLAYEPACNASTILK